MSHRLLIIYDVIKFSKIKQVPYEPKFRKQGNFYTSDVIVQESLSLLNRTFESMLIFEKAALGPMRILRKKTN